LGSISENELELNLGINLGIDLGINFEINLGNSLQNASMRSQDRTSICESRLESRGSGNNPDDKITNFCHIWHSIAAQSFVIIQVLDLISFSSSRSKAQNYYDELDMIWSQFGFGLTCSRVNFFLGFHWSGSH